VVLVNSTTGLSAIWRGIPVYALADPIYKMHGLTSGGSLHEFWSRQEKPDLDLYHAFRRVLLHVNHVNGDYFTPEGIRLAVQGCARMFANPSPLDKLLAAVPLQSLA
jgi:capsular polysaccharide export protein